MDLNQKIMLQNDIEFGNVNTKVNGDRGWILGNFEKLKSTSFFNESFEVKWSKLAKGESKSGVGTNSKAKSVTIMIYGKFRIHFPNTGETKILDSEGDYAFFGPGVAHTWEALEDTFNITLRWPSIPDDQTKITV